MPVNSSSTKVLGDFYAAHPQFETSARQTDRAYPWFDRPGQNGARISQIVLDLMAAIVNGAKTAPLPSGAIRAALTAASILSPCWRRPARLHR